MNLLFPPHTYRCIGTKDKDIEVKEDPTRFYLVDAAEIAKSSPVLGYK